MLADLIRALGATALILVPPGWFWAKCLLGEADFVEWLAYAIALSLALVSGVALVLTHLPGGGVTTSMAVISPLIVLGTGIIAYLWLGTSDKGLADTLARAPASAGVLVLAPVIGAFALVLFSDLENLPLLWFAVGCQGWPTRGCVLSGYAQRFMVPIVFLLLAAGIAYLFASRRQAVLRVQLSEETMTGRRRPPAAGRAQRFALPAVLALVLVRGYLGPVLHDWPYIRGLDNYSHAVMANMMMSDGKIYPYLIYPPGFHTLTAVVSRLSGLDPLDIFPVLGPSLLLLPALSCYVLARRLWGEWCGVVAALFSGTIMGGSYYYFNDAMYPNLVAAQFLLVLTVGALIQVYHSSSARSSILLALLGSSVVLYHQVSSLYLALLLALVAALFLPYLLIWRRKTGIALLFGLVLLGFLSVLYAWSTYDFPQTITNLIGGHRADATKSAMSMALGTQGPYSIGTMIVSVVSQPVAWLGLLGAILVVADMRGWTSAPEVLTRATLVIWAMILFIGSRTTYSGFPQRFARDLDVPLSIFAALALVVILRELLERRDTKTVYAASLVTVLVGSLLCIRLAQSYQQAIGPSPHQLMTPRIAAAGEWLKKHNNGGNIMVSPQITQVPSRMMLATGHYSALQSFTEAGIMNARDLPPTGSKPLWDVLEVMNHPEGEQTSQLLKKYDVRYIVLYKHVLGRPVVGYWQLFKARPDLYRIVFENKDVLIAKRR